MPACAAPLAQTCPDCDGAGQKIDKPCRACRGSGRRERGSKIKLKIPPGVDNGARLRSAGNGESGVRGGPPGDLYVVLHVREHGLFNRDGDDLICEVPVSFTQAALGADIEVPTMSGRSTVRMPSGTQHGTVFRLRGKGVQNIQGHGVGGRARIGSGVGDDDGLPVGDRIDVDLDPLDKPIDAQGSFGCNRADMRKLSLEITAGIREIDGKPADHIRRAHDHWVADSLNERMRIAPIACEPALWLQDAEPIEECREAHAILCLVDRLE